MMLGGVLGGDDTGMLSEYPNRNDPRELNPWISTTRALDVPATTRGNESRRPAVRGTVGTERDRRLGL